MSDLYSVGKRIEELKKDIRGLKRQNQATIKHMTETDKMVMEHEKLMGHLKDDHT